MPLYISIFNILLIAYFYQLNISLLYEDTGEKFCSTMQKVSEKLEKVSLAGSAKTTFDTIRYRRVVLKYI